VEDDLGDPDEPIEEAGWVDALPENVFERAFTAEVLDRCRTNRR
jgi:hypothetical protein